MEQYIYSDASFHPPTKMAVCGFLKNNFITYQILYDTTNIKAEIHAFEMAKLNDDADYIFGSDCQKVIDNGLLHGLTMFKVKGHKPTSQKSQIDIQFSVLDKFLRKYLRQIIKDKIN